MPKDITRLLQPDCRFVDATLDNLAQAWTASGAFRVPAFQRAVTWDERRVALLWDSVLRGMPIGALLVARSRELPVRLGQTSRSDALDASLHEASDDHLALLDGQQRVSTLASGWRDVDSEKADERLWLDLAFVPDRRDTRRFAFYQCTRALPWGPGDEDSGARRANVDEFLMRADRRTPLSRTWPHAASLPVPFAGVRRLHAAGELLTGWRGLVPPLPHEWPKNAEGAAERTLDRLARALPRLDEYFVPVIRLEPSQVERDDVGSGESDVLSEIFARLNSAGVPLNQAELFLSAVKARWPAALGLLESTFADSGRVMTPQELIHLAVRLPDRDGIEDWPTDVVRLTLRDFHALDARLASQSSSFETVLAPRLGSGKGSLAHAMRRVREALALRESQDDPGLPTLLLVQVSWRAWHSMAAWLIEGAWDEVPDEHRLSLMQYAMLDRLLVDADGTDPIKVPLAFARSSTSGFPTATILQHLASDDRPQDVERAARMLLEEQATEPMAPAPIRNGLDVLAWCQRRALDAWFRHYDTSRLLAVATRPWDVDHLIAWNRLDRRSVATPSGSFFGVRDRWRDDIGNYRYWPAPLNRGDKDKTLEAKHLTRETIPGDRMRDAPWGLGDAAAVRSCSAFGGDEEERAAWIAADGETAYAPWTDDRVAGFERAAFTRRRRMMRDFIDGLALRPILEAMTAGRTSPDT